MSIETFCMAQLAEAIRYGMCPERLLEVQPPRSTTRLCLRTRVSRGGSTVARRRLPWWESLRSS